MSAWMSHFKVLCLSFFYVIGKALAGELSCTGTGLVILGCWVYFVTFTLFLMENPVSKHCRL